MFALPLRTGDHTAASNKNILLTPQMLQGVIMSGSFSLNYHMELSTAGLPSVEYMISVQIPLHKHPHLRIVEREDFEEKREVGI